MGFGLERLDPEFSFLYTRFEKSWLGVRFTFGLKGVVRFGWRKLRVLLFGFLLVTLCVCVCVCVCVYLWRVLLSFIDIFISLYYY